MQITVRSYLELEDTNILDNLMRLYCSAKRYAYNRLLENHKTKNELKKEIQYKFSINARYSYAAIEDAKMVITSQKKLLPMYVKDLKSKIEKSNKKLKKTQEPIMLLLCGYEEHIKNKTIPKIIFGGNRAFMDLQKGKITNVVVWKDIRTNQLYSIGGKDDGGNQNLRLEHIKDILINIGERKWMHGKILRVFLMPCKLDKNKKK